MNIKENTLFDIDSGVKVTFNVAQYPLHHVTCAPAKFEVAASNDLAGDAFTKIHYLTCYLDLGIKVS